MIRKLALSTAAAAMLVAFIVQPANAALITFETSGVFQSTGENYVTRNGVTLTFDGLLTTLNVDETGALTSFGTFDVTGGHASTGGLDGETFLLTITQLEPSGEAAFSSTMAGQINRNNSNAILTFSDPLSQEIYGYLYAILSAQLNLPATGNSVYLAGEVFQLGTSGGDLPGPEIVDPETGTENETPTSQVPEPGSVLLFGAGLLAAGRRFRRSIAA